MIVPIASLTAIAALALAAPDALRRFDDYPQTQIDYYVVSATTASDLRAELRRLGPNDGGANDATARAYYTFAWEARSDGPKACNATVSITTRIRFPRHANPAAMSPALRAEWTRFIRALEHHEVGHIAIAYEALPKIKAAIESGPCPGAQERANAVDKEFRRKQEAFDADPLNKVTGLREVD